MDKKELCKKRINRPSRAAVAVRAPVRVQAKYMNKQPKFFCENCNAEVRRDAVICPYCGRFFASVRCPSCGFTGTHKEFKDGCPSCGYAFTPDVQEDKKNNTKKIKKKKFHILRYIKPKNDIRTDADPLPLWIYGVVILLCVVLAALFFFL
ncbi:MULTISPECIES: double zinc ribbon domain-containing protein [Treponema]|uniref:double zinc ribbon domain-containing protein n=1 Tax=Treponema TaxID=157 RepID=UPI001E4C544D|nr:MULTISPECIES: zinc ribbon domain-containing protein [Treponema]